MAAQLLATTLATTLATASKILLGYFLVVNSGHLLLIVLAAPGLRRRPRRVPVAGLEETYRSPLAPAISVVVPAFDEEDGITESIRAMLALRYPVFEVIVVDDGSTDSTFERLRAEYDLIETARVVPDAVPTRGPISSVHVPRLRPDPLVVVRKAHGGRSDALNVGVNAAHHPLVCMTDADSILEPQALLAVARPFLDDPLRVVASSGVVRVANGCTVLGRRVVDVRMPRAWLPRIQVVEYLRTFLLGGTGWSRLNGLVVPPRTLGLLRRDAVVAVGGMELSEAGPDPERAEAGRTEAGRADADLLLRLHEWLRDRGPDYRIVTVGDLVSWAEAPRSARVLGRQRRSGQRDLCETVWKYRRMVGNPRYGRLGLVALPYCLLFEALAPVVELVALVLVPAAYLLGAVDAGLVLALLIGAYGYAFVVSLVALAVEELASRRYRRWRDLAAAVVASALEQLGFRQLQLVWRLKGVWDLLVRP